LDPVKGIDLLLRAFARLRAIAPTATLRIVGRGSQRAALEQLTAALDLVGVVDFRGYVAPSEVEHQLTDAWALVVPSLWAEPLGLVALEAIARGVPVIASANGGLGEVVRHGTSGFVFPNGDEDALLTHLAAIATKTAFADHTLPESLVAETRDLHSESRHVERLREIFRAVTAARSAPSVSRTA
jgi:glycosyltransferase involved in cell wall biosynthesis